ncbi:MAG: pilus assembly protein TadG-related protein [Alphaproteobacteria bacterium]
MLRLLTLLTSFRRAQDGAAMPLIGLAIFMMIAAAGMAIDMSRAQIAQSRLSNALDAAGLAAGSVASSGDINAVAQKYFDANFPSGFMGTNLSTLTVVPDATNEVIVLDIDGTVDTVFMHMLGIDDVDIAAHTEITRASRGMELVMVLDNTGSMSGSKLTALKDAAETLVNILYGSKSEIDNLWIGLVPFAQAVNIGTAHNSWTSGTFNWGTTSWMGCVDAREASGRDITDDPPSVALFPKYYWACHSSYNGWYGTNSSRTNCSTGSGWRYKSGLGVNVGPNKYCSQPVTQMTKSKATILAGIDDMEANGNTHIVLGAAWGWRMLSPRWRGLWGGEMDDDELPLDYNTPLMDKVLIVMTDGENVISNSVRGAYGYLSQGTLGTTSQNGAENELDERLTDVCDAVKDEGIIVYTIAFGNPGSGIQNLLRDCASKPEYFFNSSSNSELQSAFEQIGDALANLRISK